MTFTRAVAINNWGPAKFVVDGTTVANGTHSTIASALTSASSGDTIFIRPGTYTENLTLKAGVNLTAFGSDSSQNGTGKVIISGTCTLTTAGSVTISGIQLQTNSAALLAVTGSAASIVNLENCYINCTNNTGITFSSSDAGAKINCSCCVGNLVTTGIAYFTHTSAGGLVFQNCNLMNSGSSVTNSTCASGGVVLSFTNSSNAITTSSTGSVNGTHNNFYSVNNNTALTLAGTNTCSFVYTQFTGGTSSAISIGAGCTFNGIQCDFNSTNTNAVTGAGTTGLIGCTFTNTSKINNATAQTGGFGTGTQVAPSAGFIGERLTANASSVGVTNATETNITSISLTPGVWDVSGMNDFVSAGAVTGTSFRLGINTTSATLPGSGGINQLSTPTAPNAASSSGLTVCPQRYVLTATTTVYLVCRANYTVGTVTTNGIITATRVG